MKTTANNPAPADILSARQHAGLTQVKAAALVHASARSWSAWETGAAPMPPALFELFIYKIRRLK